VLETTLTRALVILGALSTLACGPEPTAATPATTATPRKESLRLPFQLRGRTGTVSIAYDVNHDPARWGFDLLRLPFPVDRTIGFPVFEARVLYSGEGYTAVMGWIQVVTVHPAAGGADDTSVDQIPVLRESDTPFFVLGNEPTAFDAPGPNPPRTDETWTAFTFLVACPDVGRTRRVEALLGVRWGYTLVAGKPTPFPVAVVSADAWDRVVPTLRERYPNWEFLTGFGERPPLGR
jgi:hypothetical protein